MRPDARLGDTEQFTAPDGWHAARTVPGTVYQDLIDGGALPDPLIGRQETAVQWVAERDWCYRLDFDLAADARCATKVALVFEGLDTFARSPGSTASRWPRATTCSCRCVWTSPRGCHYAGPSRHTLWIRFDSALRRGRALEAHHGARPLWNGDPRPALRPQGALPLRLGLGPDAADLRAVEGGSGWSRPTCASPRTRQPGDARR